MKYNITRINRIVDLNDELVTEYLKYNELHEQTFSIVVKSTFGHNPTVQEITDKALSEMCNDILLSELKALSILPKAVKTVETYKNEIENATKNNQCISIKIK